MAMVLRSALATELACPSATALAAFRYAVNFWEPFSAPRPVCVHTRPSRSTLVPTGGVSSMDSWMNPALRGSPLASMVLPCRRR